MSAKFPKLTTIGITGKIGSGKSTVRSILEEKNIPTIDCDELAHEIYQPLGIGTQRIATFFGEEYLSKDGGVNRKKLVRTLFKAPKKWEILNRMIHPLVADRLQRQLRRIEGNIAAVEIAVYDEKIFDDYIDALWVIDTADHIRARRIKSRQIKPEYFEAISKQQANPRNMKAHYLQNDGKIEDLKKSIEDALKGL